MHLERWAENSYSIFVRPFMRELRLAKIPRRMRIDTYHRG